VGFLSTFYSVNAQPYNAGVTTVGTATACPNTIITVPVSLSGVTAVSGFSLAIYYDATVLSALQVANTSNFIVNINNTCAPLTSWGYAQTTKSAGVKQIKLGWNSSSALQLDTDVNGVAKICDVKFRYLGGNTALTFDNSSQSGGNCEYTDNDGNPMIDVPTANYYHSGSVSQGAPPAAPGAINGSATPCQGTNLYSVTNTSGLVYVWTAPAGWVGTSLTNSVTFTISASSVAGTLSVIDTNACGHSTATSLTITNIGIPSVVATSATSSVDPVCSGSSTTLTVNGGTLGDGADWNWYAFSCGGTHVGSSANLLRSPATTTTYYVRAEGLCNTTACVQVTVNVSANSVAATSISSTSAAICPGGSTTLGVTGGTLGAGANWNWYSVSCGGTVEGSGATFLANPAVTTDYYLRAEGSCNTTACVNVTITVNSNSTDAATATASPNTVCSGAAVSLGLTGGSLGTAATWQWYSVSCGGTSEGNGATLVVTPAATATYYVRAEGTCNTSNCVNVTVTVNDNSVAATAVTSNLTTICNGVTATLGITGGTLGTSATWQWYEGSCGGATAGAGATNLVNPTATTVYYLRAEGTCNTTACANITIIVDDLSVAATSATSTASTVCAGTAITLNLTGGSLGTGAQWLWYDGTCGGGTSIGNGTSLVLSPNASTSYFVRAEGNCNSTNCVNVAVTVNDNSVAATSASSLPSSVCAGGSAALSLTGGALGTGATWNWYTTSCGVGSAGVGATINVTPAMTTSFYVRAEGTCNTTSCVFVTVTVLDTSVTASSAIANPGSVCLGTSTNLNVSGGTLGYIAAWVWFDGGCGTSTVGNGSTLAVTPTASTTYYVRAQGQCNTTPCVNVTVNLNINSFDPTAATTVDDTVCLGSSTTLGVTGGSLGTGGSWNWYTVSCGGTSAGIGTTIVITPASTNTYYVRAEGLCNTTTCVNVTVNMATYSTAATTAIASNNNPQQGQSVSLSRTGGTLGTNGKWWWYEGSCGGTLVGSGSNYTINPANTGQLYYYLRAEGYCNTTTCVSVGVYVHPLGINTPESNEFAVSNYPNPFNGTTEIEFTMPQAGNVSIDVYNVVGKHVATISNNTFFSEGKHIVSFDAAKLQEGVYPYKVRVTINNKVNTVSRTMNIVR